MPRARSQRASQNPSRPASKATAMRVIVRPFWVASARQRMNKRSNSTSLGSSFFSGWRSRPGTMPATSQLAWLISITAMIVLSCSRGVRDLLKSSSCCAMGRSIAWLPATMVTSRHRLPHSISGDLVSVAETGERKSAVDALALRPAEQHEKVLRGQHEALRQAHSNANDAYTTAREQVRKTNKALHRDAIQEALDALGPAPEPPRQPMLLTTEPT